MSSHDVGEADVIAAAARSDAHAAHVPAAGDQPDEEIRERTSCKSWHPRLTDANILDYILFVVVESPDSTHLDIFGLAHPDSTSNLNLCSMRILWLKDSICRRNRVLKTGSGSGVIAQNGQNLQNFATRNVALVALCSRPASGSGLA